MSNEIRKFSFEDKENAVKTYLACGNMRLTAATIGCSVQTLEAWKKQDWWKHLVESIRLERTMSIDTKMSRLIDTSLDLLEDRLTNGDFILNNKTGAIVRKPVSLKDLNNVSTNLLTRQQVLHDSVDQKVEREDSMKDVLSFLKQEFASWSRKESKKNATTLDFKEVDNAIYEEREEGLQEGSGSLYLETGSEEEES